jgi:hypothetical protein
MRRCLGLILVVLSLGAGCGHTTKEPTPDERAVIAERLREEMREAAVRLDLTQEQREAIRPILEASIQKRRALVEKHMHKLKSLRSSRKLRADLMQLNQETERKLAAILDAGQLEEYRLIVKELREKAMEEFRRRHAE